MPIPPLVAMFQSADVAQASAAEEAPLIDQGIVLAVYDTSLLLQQADGRIVDATQSTDEPFQAGDAVLIARTDTTPVVLGRA